LSLRAIPAFTFFFTFRGSWGRGPIQVCSHPRPQMQCHTVALSNVCARHIVFVLDFSAHSDICRYGVAWTSTVNTNLIRMGITWAEAEEAEVAAQNRSEWRRSVAQCIHLDAGWIKAKVKAYSQSAYFKDSCQQHLALIGSKCAQYVPAFKIMASTVPSPF